VGGGGLAPGGRDWWPVGGFEGARAVVRPTRRTTAWARLHSGTRAVGDSHDPGGARGRGAAGLAMEGAAPPPARGTRRVPIMGGAAGTRATWPTAEMGGLIGTALEPGAGRCGGTRAVIDDQRRTRPGNTSAAVEHIKTGCGTGAPPRLRSGPAAGGGPGEPRWSGAANGPRKNKGEERDWVPMGWATFAERVRAPSNPFVIDQEVDVGLRHRKAKAGVRELLEYLSDVLPPTTGTPGFLRDQLLRGWTAWPASTRSSSPRHRDGPGRRNDCRRLLVFSPTSGEDSRSRSHGATGVPCSASRRWRYTQPNHAGCGKRRPGQTRRVRAGRSDVARLPRLDAIHRRGGPPGRAVTGAPG